jgi:hypothetical protein
MFVATKNFKGKFNTNDQDSSTYHLADKKAETAEGIDQRVDSIVSRKKTVGTRNVSSKKNRVEPGKEQRIRAPKNTEQRAGDHSANEHRAEIRESKSREQRTESREKRTESRVESRH